MELALLDPGQQGIALGDFHRLAQGGGDYDTAARSECQSQPVRKTKARPLSIHGIEGHLGGLGEALTGRPGFTFHLFPRHDNILFAEVGMLSLLCQQRGL
jgi:hypothetical protein